MKIIKSSVMSSVVHLFDYGQECFFGVVYGVLIFMTVWYVKMESISQFSRQFHFCLSKSVLCLWYQR